MLDDACSRREFVKKFAMLSGGALMLSATAIGCSGGTKNMFPSVIGMHFYDGGMNKVELRGSRNVPVHTRFSIVFSTGMNSALITFVNSNSNPVVFTEVWDDARTLSLTPSADLSPSTDYILTVKEAVDSEGHGLNQYANASAAFGTASI